MKEKDLSICAADNLSMAGRLWSGDIEPLLYEVDFSNLAYARDVLHHANPSQIFHLAANSDIQKSSISPLADLHDTFQTTVSLCIAIVERGISVDRLIFSSSSAVFGQKEGKISEDEVGNPESPYGWMKLASEILLESLYATGLVNELIILRFPNVTGVGQTHGVIRDLVEKYLSQNEPWEILGDGSQTKPYVHVSELVEILGSLVFSDQKRGLIRLNISPDDTISVKRIVELIELRGRLGRNPTFGTSPRGWQGDIPYYSLDNSKQASLGYKVMSSESAIIRSIDEEFIKYGA
jgi:UDP-glucose 4-epimerase